MKKKLLKTIPLIIASIFGLSLISPNVLAEPVEGLNPQGKPAAAASSGNACDANLPPEILEASGCNSNSNALPTIIQNILYAIIAILGLVAVIYIIIGGVNYMTSAGDTGKLEKAKKTILYACIGLAVCALAFAIVNWTISAINYTPKNATSFATKDECTKNGFTWKDNKCQ